MKVTGRKFVHVPTVNFLFKAFVSKGQQQQQQQQQRIGPNKARKRSNKKFRPPPWQIQKYKCYCCLSVVILLLVSLLRLRSSKLNIKNRYNTNTMVGYHNNDHHETIMEKVSTHVPQLDTLLSRSSSDERSKGGGGKIIGNVDFLLNYAIIGFGKCGTSTLIQWLCQHKEIHSISKHEVWLLQNKKPAVLVEKLYHNYQQQLYSHYQHEMRSSPSPFHIIQGYKNPTDIMHPHSSLEYIKQYFPQTKLIVTIRHPVLWYHSLINFFRHEMGRHGVNDTTILEKSKTTSSFVCLCKGEFHRYLAQLGKTSVTSKEEISLLKSHCHDADTTITSPSSSLLFSSIQNVHLPNKVFLLETTQLADTNDTRNTQFRYDMGNFVGIQKYHTPTTSLSSSSSICNDDSNKKNDHVTTKNSSTAAAAAAAAMVSDNNGDYPQQKNKLCQDQNPKQLDLLPPIPHVRPGTIKKERKKGEQKHPTDTMFHICNESNDQLRQELMYTARNASLWIRNYFLSSSDVLVSSPAYFHQIMLSWMEDPCDDRSIFLGQ